MYSFRAINATIFIMEEDIWQLSEDAVLEKLITKKTGLSEAQVFKKREEFGHNALSESKKRSKLRIFLENFRSPLVYILLIAGLITWIMGKTTDTIVILSVTILNSIIGFFQEYKAEKTLEALKKFTNLKCTVIRSGHKTKILSSEIVPGDIVVLEEGDKIPADGRVIESQGLYIDEAVLTGESFPVEKQAYPSKEKSYKDANNILFMGTLVSSGRGLMVVSSTGVRTELGRISKLVEDELETITPLQRKLEDFSKKLGVYVLGICVLIFIIGIILGNSVILMFETSISLAVSAIPEGLPVAITVIFILGINRMATKKAIVRRLVAVETLGTTTIICTDKTGTLTHNKLTVSEIYTDDIYQVSGDGYSFIGKFSIDGVEINPRDHLRILLSAGVIANNGDIKAKNGKNEIFGDPIDCALLVAAHKGGVKKEDIYEETSRLDEIPFTSERKVMAVLAENSGAKVVYIKGAYEEVIKRCQFIYSDKEKGVRKLSIEEAKRVSEVVSKMASKGLRVIALAYKEEDIFKKKINEGDIKKGFVLIGLVGMRDTYKAGVKEAIALCKRAGIKIVMLTGDHIETATVIGKELGILKNEDEAIVAREVESLSREEIDRIVAQTTVYARISPEAKYKIVDAYKDNGEIVAMTGDGVNDVAALKKADIGISMGLMGTEAAKDASDMILTDDNFSTIVAAIEEGRVIFENIRKTIFFLLATNLGEVLTIFVGLILGLPLILEPVQILWMNMVTDTAATIPLGMEPAEDDHLAKPPREPKEPILSKLMFFRIFLIAATMTTVAIIVFTNALSVDEKYARTLAFAVLIISQWFNALNARSENQSIFKMNFFSNKPLLFGLALSLIAQLFVMYIGFFENVFDLTTLNLKDWLLVILASSSVIFVSEMEKLFRTLIKAKNF